MFLQRPTVDLKVLVLRRKQYRNISQVGVKRKICGDDTIPGILLDKKLNVFTVLALEIT